MEKKTVGKTKRSNKLTLPFKILKPVANFLSQEIKRLERRKEAIATEDPFNDTRRVSDNAASDTEVAEQTGHERAKALERQANRKIIQLKKALSRIKIGRYGNCEKCGRFIDTDRLVIMPEATLCVKCEKKKEK